MSENETLEEEDTNLREALSVLIFRDNDENEIKRFSGLNLLPPAEGEEIILQDVEITAGDKDPEPSTEEDSYKVEKVSKTYSDLSMKGIDEESKEDTFDPNAPVIYYAVTLSPVNGESDDNE